MKYSCTPTDEAAGKDRQTKLEFAVTGLKEAELYVEKVSAKRASHVAKLNQNWGDFDPLADDDLAECSQVRIEIQVLEQWLANPPPLVRAVEILRQELAATKPLILSLAQFRCAAEHVVSKCLWSQRLAGLEMKSLSSQISESRRIAIEVLNDLTVLLAAKRGAELTPDEIRLGIFQRGFGLGHRPLTFEERQGGVAFE